MRIITIRVMQVTPPTTIAAYAEQAGTTGGVAMTKSSVGEVASIVAVSSGSSRTAVCSA